MVRPERIRQLNEHSWPAHGTRVLYWMQQSQRVRENQALEYALGKANELAQPLNVVFCLTAGFPEANLRHYTFMLEGLPEIREALRARAIGFDVFVGSPTDVLPALTETASLLVTDRGYLRCQRAWRQELAQCVRSPLVEIEGDAVVPVDTVSLKEEYAAATIRRKIERHMESFLSTEFSSGMTARVPAQSLGGVAWETGKDLLRILKPLDCGVAPSKFFHGGQGEAERRLRQFLENDLQNFHEHRNNPGLIASSCLSAYLHFGQISPVAIAREAASRKTDCPEAVAAFLEELVVRRELSINFVERNPCYDSWKCLPDWAKATLSAHAVDRRPTVYSLGELEAGETHDPYWNAAQQEMVISGKMHGYMRMYWGKKVLEWTEEPEEAYSRLLYLNNKYELDGRDVNGFAGVAWCFGKHDRPWQQRPIFGTVRYMNANGLRRKFNMDAYIERVRNLDPGPHSKAVVPTALDQFRLSTKPGNRPEAGLKGK